MDHAPRREYLTERGRVRAWLDPGALPTRRSIARQRRPRSCGRGRSLGTFVSDPLRRLLRTALLAVSVVVALGSVIAGALIGSMAYPVASIDPPRHPPAQEDHADRSNG
jgi:hypothetical protein